MSKLEVCVVTKKSYGLYVTANGEEVALTKKRGMLIGQVETDQPTVDLNITRYADVGGALWFVLQLFFFILSIFGLFDGGKRTAAAYTASFTLDASVDRKVSFVERTYNKNFPCKEGDKAVDEEITTRAQSAIIKEVENKYHLNESYNKKLKLLKLIKILMFIAVFALAVFGVIKLIAVLPDLL